jgi:hypothetical protein
VFSPYLPLLEEAMDNVLEPWFQAIVEMENVAIALLGERIGKLQKLLLFRFFSGLLRRHGSCPTASLPH